MATLPLTTSFRRASTGKRLWLGGVAIGVFALTLVVGNACVAPDRAVTRRMLGHDFLAFYTAGSFVRDGRSRELYDLDSVRDYEHRTAEQAGLEVGPSFGPWWNPPFYALAFRPLASLPYATALDVWRWVGLAALLGAAAVLVGVVGATPNGREPAAWGLVPLLVGVSMPVMQAASHGQNTFTSLLVLAGAVALWRAERGVAAGVVGGLLFYKPQLAAVFAAAMVLDLGWRPLVGLAVTGGALLAINMIALPGTLGDWLHRLPANVRWMQVEHEYLWDRHVTLKAFWRLLLQGRSAGEPWLATTLLTDASLLLVGGALARTLVRGRAAVWLGRATDEAPADRRLGRDRRIAATVAATPLLMPFYFDYDLLLLAVPAVLYAVERLGRPDVARNSDRRTTAAYVGLYLWLFVNPGLARVTHVDGTVPLLAVTSALATARAARREGDAAPIYIIHPQRLAMAA